MTEDRKPTRLPPPAFPPGVRRPPPDDHGPAKRTDEAFYYPEGAEGDGAVSFIAPDEPIPGRYRMHGTATGIGDDPHLSHEEIVAGGDPNVLELTIAVSKLAEDLKRRGKAGLHASPEMSRFETTLRAYCVGFLAGRAVPHPVPDDDEG